MTRFSPVARRGHIGRLVVGQIVALQVAAVTVAATYPLTDWVFVPAVLAALGVVGAAFGRRDGRWWYQDALLRRRLSHRRRAGRAGRRRAGRRRAGPAVGQQPQLRVLAPSLSVRDVVVRGMRLGLGQDDDGWFVVCAVRRAGADGERAGPGVSVDGLVRVLAGVDAPVSALQLVHHTGAAAAARPAARAQVWVALRLAARDAPAAAASRGGGLDGVHRTLATAVGVLGRALPAAGLDHRPLAAGEVVAALGTVWGWEPAAPGGPDQLPEEQWSAWHSAGAAHACFRLGGASPRPLDDLVAGLGRIPVLSFTVSVLLRHHPAADPSSHGLLRLATGAGPDGGTVDDVTDLAAGLGITCRRLDGVHGPALYAVAPTGTPPPGDVPVR